MTGGIYVLQDDGELVEMTECAYDSEALLQGLLALERVKVEYVAITSVTRAAQAPQLRAAPAGPRPGRPRAGRSSAAQRSR